MEEIQNTVLDMKNNKAPCPDGSPIEKAFFIYSIIKIILHLFTTLIVLNVYFHYLTKSGMVISLKNSASLISIPKKGDLSDCNNYSGISLINVDLKIISKIVTNRIDKYALDHKFVKPEQFGFRNKEECMSNKKISRKF